MLGVWCAIHDLEDSSLCLRFKTVDCLLEEAVGALWTSLVKTLMIRFISRSEASCS